MQEDRPAMSRQLSARLRYSLLISVLLLGTAYYFCLPVTLFRKPYSFVAEAKDGTLLGARIAADGQWRFPGDGQVPAKFEKALLCFEDKRFRWHTGFDPAALVRALWTNLREGGVRQGGSTITMQVISLSRGRKSAGILEKLWEILLATRLEWRYSKDQILELYATHAPFGGNVVGLEAACWRYYGKDKSMLTWGEAATLAVLPNSPALIHPGRNREALRRKRDHLLTAMAESGILDHEDALLAMDEPLPDKPYPLPRLAPHLLDRFTLSQRKNTTPEYRLQSTLSPELQQAMLYLAARKAAPLRESHIYNLSLLVVDNHTGEVLVYIGNSPLAGDREQGQVDVIPAPRSTGSILKPLLFSAMLSRGELMPDALIPDVPTVMGNFRPENYHKRFDGAVPASNALIRSLNVPFAILLRQYGVDRWLRQLQKSGLSHLNAGAGHYGLSLILGGGEASLWDITQCYHHLAAGVSLQATDKPSGITYRLEDRDRVSYPEIDPGAAWLTLNILTQLNRPNHLGEWERFASARQVAWKTGTSHGFRDAWAVGTTPDHTIGVWVGNASGEGRPGILGIEAAAPILFEAFDLLPPGNWFDRPDSHLRSYRACTGSGWLAGPDCPASAIWLPAQAQPVQTCVYHQTGLTERGSGLRVTYDCAGDSPTDHRTWFVLPPQMEHYYRDRHPDYTPPPRWKSGCDPDAQSSKPISWIYPAQDANITLPRTTSGQPGKAIFRIAHRRPDQRVFWFLDGELAGVTRGFHELGIEAGSGSHEMICTDEEGYSISRRFVLQIPPEEGASDTRIRQ